MRLATLRTAATTVAVRLDDRVAVEVEGRSDVGALLAKPDWRTTAAAAAGPARPLTDIPDTAWAPVIPRPGKIVCVGLNYREHILERDRELPAFPTLFAKYPEALIGPFDPILLPLEAPDAVDWEGELAVVVGSAARRVDEAGALAAIAGYAVFNDVSMRDYQNRSHEWMQGKAFEGSTPFGPCLVTADEFQPGGRLSTLVDGEVMQSAVTDGLVFPPAALVSYLSHILTLQPGDVVAPGTPGGVGHARTPPKRLYDGVVLTTSIEGIGTMANPVVLEV